MRIGYAVEGRTWGPYVRARAVAARTGATVVGTGEPRPPVEGLPYRRVRWTDPDCLAGFDLVLGDPSVVARRPAGVRGIAVRIAGQSDEARPVELVWDAEARPIHPWAYEVLPTRRAASAYLRSGRSSGDPLLVVLDQTVTPGVLARIVRDHAPPGWEIVELVGWGEDRWIVGADLLVTSGGWSQTVQARAAGVPYVAVEQSGSDQWLRAHCTLRELPIVAANLDPRPAVLDLDRRPYVEDHLPELLDLAGLGGWW